LASLAERLGKPVEAFILSDLYLLGPSSPTSPSLDVVLTPVSKPWVSSPELGNADEAFILRALYLVVLGTSPPTSPLAAGMVSTPAA
jgi:hypothetical protein